MINVVDSFTKLYGRMPTESELAFMMKAKADNEALKNKKLRPTENLMVKSLACQKRAKDVAAKRPLKKGISVNLRGWSVNCLLLAKLEKQTIANALCLKISEVESVIKKYKLPRFDVLKPR